MSEIQGIYITPADGRWLVDRLRAIGRADDLGLIKDIESAIAYDIDVDRLDERERHTIINALEGVPSPPRLEQLRAVLLEQQA